MADAYRDKNFVPTLIAVSSADGKTPVNAYADPNSHRLLIDAAGGVTGPGTSTDKAIARWNGTTGAVIQDSSITFDNAKTGVASSCLFSQTQTVTVASTALETNLDGTGVGSKTIPANFLIAGRTLRLTMTGIHSAVGNPSLTIKVKIDGVTVLTTGAITSGNSTNTFFEVRAFITCYTTGVGGTVWAQGFYTESGGGQNSFPMTTTSASTIDTTTSQAVSVTAQWGTASASNTMTTTNFTIDAIN